MAQGTIKWFNEEACVGFIAQTDGAADVFVSQCSVLPRDSARLRVGEFVEFEIQMGKLGPVAINVRRVVP